MILNFREEDIAAALLDSFRDGSPIAHDDAALASEALQTEDSNRHT